MLSWSHRWPSWAALGTILDHLEVLLEPSLGRLGAVQDRLGDGLGVSGAVLGHLGSSSGRLGVVVTPSGTIRAVLERSRDHLAPRLVGAQNIGFPVVWSCLGPSRSHLWPSSAALGAILDHLEVLLEPSLGRLGAVQDRLGNGLGMSWAVLEPLGVVVTPPGAIEGGPGALEGASCAETGG